MTVRQVAEALNCCRTTVYRMVESGELPATRFANNVRIAHADFEALLSLSPTK